MEGKHIISGLTNRLNVRAVPGGAIISTLANGDVVMLTGETTEGVLGTTVYMWRQTTIGWIAIVPGLTLTPYAAPEVDLGELRRRLLVMRDSIDDMLALLD